MAARALARVMRACAVLAGLGCAAAAAQSLPPGWVAHYRPGGELFVAHPQGWQVQERGGGAFAVVRPGVDGRLRALVYVKPLALAREPALADQLARLPRDEAALLPAATVTVRPQDVQPRAVLGDLRFAAGGLRYRGSALAAALAPGRGTLCVIAETEAGWPAAAPTMARILKSFAYMPPAAGADALPPLQPWRDPAEGAFTLPVPQGWAVDGGLRRPGQINLRVEVIVASPDGAIQLRLGDASVPTFGAPYAVPFAGTMPEGTVTAGGTLLWRYLPGQAFLAHYYLPRRFGAVQNLRGQPLPAWAEQSFRAAPPPPPLQGRADAGEVMFELQTPAGPRQFWYAALTRYYEVPGVNGSGTWTVETLVGAGCAPGKMAQAQAILAAMHRGFAWNPQWQAAEMRMRGEVAQAVIAHNAAMNDMVARTAQIQARGSEQAAAPRERAARGSLRVQDADGRTWEVPVTGSQDYYRARLGDSVVATDRSDLSSIDYDRLWRAP